jgi:hypothetical protein
LIPVITKISFVDPIKQYQEYQYTVDNSSQADRDVHVDQVKPSDSSGSGATLDVERIDVWKILDPIKQYQESDFKFDNVTGASDTPPHFSAHTKTHLVKWGDDSAWIQSELIDEFSVIDPIAQGQEHQFTLTGNPDVDGNGFATTQADPSDDDVTDAGTIDPPWRTDPFQNIVDFKGKGKPKPIPIDAIAGAGGFLGGAGLNILTATRDSTTISVGTPGLEGPPPVPPGVYGAVKVTAGIDVGAFFIGNWGGGSIAGTASLAVDPGYNTFITNSTAGGLDQTVSVSEVNASPPFDVKVIGGFGFSYSPMVLTAIALYANGIVTPLHLLNLESPLIFSPVGGFFDAASTSSGWDAQILMHATAQPLT